MCVGLLPDQLTTAAGRPFASKHTWIALPRAAAPWQAAFIALSKVEFIAVLTVAHLKKGHAKEEPSKQQLVEDESRITSRVGRLSVRIPRPSSVQYGRQRPLVDFCNYFLPVHRGSNFSSPGGAQLEAGCKALQKPEG